MEVRQNEFSQNACVRVIIRIAKRYWAKLMTQPTGPLGDKPESEFERAGNAKELNLLQEFVLFLRENRKWWMIPILVSLALIAMLVALSATGAAPFIYSIF